MSRLSTSWLLLVSPAGTWRGLGGGPGPALLTSAALLCLGWLISNRPMGELAQVSQLSDKPANFGSFLLLLVLLLVLFLGLAVILFAFTRILGSAHPFRSIATWLAYGLLPVFLGRCIGLLSFAVIQPLARDPREALALQVNPLGFSLAGFFVPLSFPWTVGAAFDLFTLWALVLLALGARHYLRLTAVRAAALLGALLIIWLLALTAVWQGLQRSL